MTQAYIDIDGAEADILLHASLIDGLTGRMSQAEIDIDGANAQIALKASQTSLDATNADLTAAELVIDGHTASIALHAASISTLQSTTGTHTTQINQAQIDIDAAEAAITLKAEKVELDGTLASVYSSTTTYNTGDEVRYYSTSWKLYKCKLNGTFNIVPANTTYWTALSALSGRMSQAEVDIDAAEAAITLKASQTSLDTTNGRVSAAELNISALETETGEMQAQYTVKLNVNNHVAGIGLLLAESGYSEFVILSDKFMVVNPTDTMSPKAVFTVGNVNGVSAVGINGDLIIDGSILARNIGANEIIANVANIKDALITGAKIANATIDTAQIKDLAVTSGKIGSLDASKITSGYISADRIEANTITGNKISSATAITAGSGDDVAVLTGADATYRLYAGKSTPAIAPFSVKKTGELYCSSGKVEGSFEVGGVFTNNSVIRTGWMQDKGSVSGGGGTATFSDFQTSLANFFLANSKYIIIDLQVQFWKTTTDGSVRCYPVSWLTYRGAIICLVSGALEARVWTSPWYSMPEVVVSGINTSGLVSGANGVIETNDVTALVQHLSCDCYNKTSGSSFSVGSRWRIVALRISDDNFPTDGWGTNIWQG
jgi:hypothetical protein